MLKIPVVKGNINKALKMFKRKFKQTGILKEVRERKQHIKKSTKRKIEKEKAILKRKYREENDE
jgi:small subunit ribosomal protein S21|tara:strand:+ start:466 stop:657 length:192 start_codon:yes stop_codon:yes gene_type:complete